MHFQYFEIRPAVDFGDHTESYRGEPQWCATRQDFIHTPEAAEAEAKAAALVGTVFWTLYGIDEEGLAQAIGDFKSFDAADASADLEDFINQCSNAERL